MEKQAATAFSACIMPRVKMFSNRQNEGTTTPYCEVVNYLLGTCAVDDVIAGADTKSMRLTYPWTKDLIEYAKLHWAKAVRCHELYGEYVLKSNIFRGPEGCIRQSVQSFWNSSKCATVRDLAIQAASPTNVQNSLQVWGRTCNRYNPKIAVVTNETRRPRRYTSILMQRRQASSIEHHTHWKFNKGHARSQTTGMARAWETHHLITQTLQHPLILSNVVNYAWHAHQAHTYACYSTKQQETSKSVIGGSTWRLVYQGT